jgi:glycosyltransferase involved in cell wall biosynthesis
MRRARGRDVKRALVQINSLALGGTQLNAVQFAAALEEYGWKSLLVGPRDTLPATGPSLFDVAADAGVEVQAMERPTSILRGARDLSTRARQWDADLVHVYGTHHERPAYWGPCLLGRRALLVTVYEMELSARTHRGCPLVIGTGYLLDESRDRPGPVRLVSPPVDLEPDDPAGSAEFFLRHGVDESAERLVLVSRLDESMKARSVEVAIEAVERADRPDVVLVVVGGGDAEQRLRALGAAANARLGRRAVVFTGAVADPRPAYAGADLVIGMGGSAARALGHGRRLVVLGENGWSCAFTPATADELFRYSFWSDAAPDDAAERLEAEIVRTLDDRTGRAALERYGRAFAAESFELGAMVERLAGLYDEAQVGRGRSWWSDVPFEARAFLRLGPFGRRAGQGHDVARLRVPAVPARTPADVPAPDGARA